MRLFTVIVFLCFFYSGAVLADEKIVVVVNKNNVVEIMSRSEVIDLFMGKYVAFPNGDKAIAVDLAGDHIARKIFYKKLVGKSIASVNAYWSRIRFSGKRKPPIQKEDYAQVIHFITTTQMSIGYIPKSMLTNDMKVIFEFGQ